MEPEADLTLFLNPDDRVWYITFNAEIPRIVRLFGTNTLPTPFTDHSPPEKVLAEIRAKNPNQTVELMPACAEATPA